MSYRYDEYDKAIVIEGFESGVADSPYNGIADMRCMNITSIPGEAAVQFGLTNNPGTTGIADNHFTIATGSPGIIITATAVVKSYWSGELDGPNIPTGMTAGANYIFVPTGPSGFRHYVYPTWKDWDGSDELALGGPANATGSLDVHRSGTSNTVAEVIDSSYDEVNNLYAYLDNKGKIWIHDGTSTTELVDSGYSKGLGTGGSSVFGVEFFKGYLFAFRDSKIDYADVGVGAWNYDWNAFASGDTSFTGAHYGYVAQDDRLYITDYQYICAIGPMISTGDFDPSGTANTDYLYNSAILELPSFDWGICLAELGVNLLVGGKWNAIYPWNRTATFADYPILLSENWVQRMVTVNTNTYIFAGNRGNVWVTNGAQATIFKKVPDHISGTIEPVFQWSDASYHKNQVIFGCYAVQNDGEDITNVATVGYGGLWAVDIESGALRLLQKTSADTYDGYVQCVQPIFVTNGASYGTVPSGFGVNFGASNIDGIDVSSQEPYRNNEAELTSDLIPIGTFDKPRDAARIEYKLSRPLALTEGITIYYRLDYSQSWTQVYTDSYATSGAVFSGGGPINWKNAQWLQLRVTLDGSTTGNDPGILRIKELRITGFQQTQ